MKIGISGAPGAGKTTLAKRLRTELEDCYLIDGYVQELEHEVDLALGFDATYIGNLHVALVREALERKGRPFVTKLDDAPPRYRYREPENSITCGTVFETAAYSAMAFEAEQQLISDADHQEDLVRRTEATMRTLACLYIDTFRYDHCFYLPVVGADNPQIVTLDRNIQAAFSAFNLSPVHPLVEETLDARVAHALDILKGEDESSTEGQGTDAKASV